MSYSEIAPCWNCGKKGDQEGTGKCTDLLKIQEAMNKIHSTTDGGHQGSGSIILMCNQRVPTGDQR